MSAEAKLSIGTDAVRSFNGVFRCSRPFLTPTGSALGERPAA